MPFPKKVIEDVLVLSQRCCCICHKYDGRNVNIHHIIQEADGGLNTIDNAICLCLSCHGDVGHYNPRHPIGIKFTPAEIKRHRDEWWDKCKNFTHTEITGYEVEDITKVRKFLKENSNIFSYLFNQEADHAFYFSIEYLQLIQEFHSHWETSNLRSYNSYIRAAQDGIVKNANEILEVIHEDENAYKVFNGYAIQFDGSTTSNFILQLNRQKMNKLVTMIYLDYSKLSDIAVH